MAELKLRLSSQADFNTYEIICDRGGNLCEK